MLKKDRLQCGSAQWFSSEPWVQCPSDRFYRVRLSCDNKHMLLASDPVKTSLFSSNWSRTSCLLSWPLVTSHFRTSMSTHSFPFLLFYFWNGKLAYNLKKIYIYGIKIHWFEHSPNHLELGSNKLHYLEWTEIQIQIGHTIKKFKKSLTKGSLVV